MDKYTLQEVIEFITQSNEIECIGSQEAIDDSLIAWSYLAGNNALTESIVKKTHYYIIKNLNSRIAGHYRKCNVYVGDRMGYPPYYLTISMQKWLTEAMLADTKEKIKQNHIHFEFIHPFEDGNGRTGRMMLLWQLQRAELPIEIIYSDTKHDNYYPWFRSVSAMNRYTYKPYAT